MGLDNPKEMAEAVRVDYELTDAQKEIRHRNASSQMRGMCTYFKHTSDNTHACSKMYTSRGIKRMMARVDKPDTPRSRPRRPRNGFAD